MMVWLTVHLAAVQASIATASRLPKLLAAQGLGEPRAAQPACPTSAGN
jgi:hypothetical protein